jgi:hypothetical protein
MSVGKRCEGFVNVKQNLPAIPFKDSFKDGRHRELLDPTHRDKSEESIVETCQISSGMIQALLQNLRFCYTVKPDGI